MRLGASNQVAGRHSRLQRGFCFFKTNDVVEAGRSPCCRKDLKIIQITGGKASD